MYVKPFHTTHTHLRSSRVQKFQVVQTLVSCCGHLHFACCVSWGIGVFKGNCDTVNFNQAEFWQASSHDYDISSTWISWSQGFVKLEKESRKVDLCTNMVHRYSCVWTWFTCIPNLVRLGKMFQKISSKKIWASRSRQSNCPDYETQVISHKLELWFIVVHLHTKSGGASSNISKDISQ